MPLKSNHPYIWSITLIGKTACKRFVFEGTSDEALHEADVLECGVRFAVREYRLIRRKRIKKTKP